MDIHEQVWQEILKYIHLLSFWPQISGGATGRAAVFSSWKWCKICIEQMCEEEDPFPEDRETYINTYLCRGRCCILKLAHSERAHSSHFPFFSNSRDAGNRSPIFEVLFMFVSIFMIQTFSRRELIRPWWFSRRGFQKGDRRGRLSQAHHFSLDYPPLPPMPWSFRLRSQSSEDPHACTNGFSKPQTLTTCGENALEEWSELYLRRYN